MSAREWNFDGLVGPTHNYAGLSPGNLASSRSAGSRSHPRAAALQGLGKMALLHGLGVPQAVLPPQPRPDLGWLRRLGFDGSAARVVERAARDAPRLLAAAYSASSMWAANAATVVPSADAADGRVHVIPANLTSERHRSLEPPHTARMLGAVLPDPERFVHHPPVPLPGDEGAANHLRLCPAYGRPGIEVFVFGQAREGGAAAGPGRYPARQAEEASRAVARLAHLDPVATRFCQQDPHAIDAGVFHNDVIATGDRDLLFLHEDAFRDQPRVLDGLREVYASRCGGALRVVEVGRDALALDRAVATYLFNCQIVAAAGGGTAWIGPLECREDATIVALLDGLAGDTGPFDALHFVDLRESMRNGGGPACLRLRVVMTPAERAAAHAGVFFDEALHRRLARVIETHYREELAPEDLADPALVDEARAAYDAVLEALDLAGLLHPETGAS